MHVGITIRFANSYFSGSVPQQGLALGKALGLTHHKVTYVYPKGEASWFVDLHSMKEEYRREEWSKAHGFDLLIEVGWALPPAERTGRVVSFVHYPPIFFDMESSVYPWNPSSRNFENLSAIWTYDHYSKQDIRYLEFLSGVKVVQIPYAWDPRALDVFVMESGLPTWIETAKRVDSLIPPAASPVSSWCARIVESNFSNASHCILPLNIVSQIRARGLPIRFTVHNSDHTAKSEFFQNNVVKNLILPDVSGNLVPRVRLPDLLRDKTFFVAHQRFRPLKTYLLDAYYLGIPFVHNCEILRDMGMPYFYDLNQINQASDCFRSMMQDYEAQRGFFDPTRVDERKSLVRGRFSPSAVCKRMDNALLETTQLPAPLRTVVKKDPLIGKKDVLRVAFCDMWSNFQPKYNFFMYLLSWIGSQNNMSVELDMANPNLVVFGPFRKGDEQRYPGVPKVFFTGENSGPNTHPDTFLNLGFRYDMGPSYIRLPLWVLEINWWGADPEKIQNPKPVPLADCLTVKPELLDRKQKFCAFVATNPCNSTRNEAFQILNRWRPVDSAGRLFCNRAEGPIAGGMGGGGGELSKVDYYKDYQFALTFENSSAPGYTTEKLFHAKVAGCVPIYWGDAFVDRDFDARGFINANQLGTAQGFIDLVAKVVNDPHEWRKMASVPALSATKKKWCEQTMESVGKAIFQRILGTDVQVQWAHALSFGGAYEGLQAPVQMPVQVASQFTPQVSSQAPVQVASHFTPQAPVQAPIQAPIQAPSHVLTNDGSKTIVLATNANYIESAVNLLGSCAKEQCTKVVYVWPDVKLGDHTLLMKHGATEIRTFPCATEQPWQDFWEPKHFAWKLWLLSDAHAKAEAGAKLLYLDAGIVIAKNLSNIWSWIEEKGCFLINDPTQLNERWCHPKFCSAMNVLPQELKKTQLWAGCVGFAKGGVFDSILLDAFDWAKNRDVIVGNKWQPYSTVCMGHRHDQSILSILTDRRGLPRALLDDHYCDRSMRATLQHGVSFYVHRGTYRDFVPFVDKIDEAYVINLERRDDRKKRFIASHTNISERVYLWKAVDGRSLSLRPEITHLFRQNDFSWKKSVMGCALSHYSLWQKLATDPLAKSYLILEDDVVLEERWLLKWVQASNFFPADADVVYLGGVLPPNKGVFPTIVDPVNPHFAKVKPNAVFGGSLRRYFHFCNYAYILTQQGARKLCSLIQDRGIFTSGDHMIVNHGDSLLNIYFTTPLLATCYQEQDPVYQTSQFNNFSRIDNFDSDLWNNDDRFSMEEVQKCQPNAAPLASANTSSHEDHILVWNAFLRHISQNQRSEITKSIDAVFAIWKHQSLEEFQTNIGWFRVFEQLIQAKQPALLEHAQHIRARITGLVSAIPSSVWSNILSALPSQTEATDTIRIFHMNEVNPQGLMEHAWLQSIFPKPLSWTPLASAQSLQGCANPVVLYMNLPGRNDYVRNALQSILHELEASGTQVTMLHLSDEFHTDKIDIYGSKAVKQVLRTYWRKDLAQYGEKVYVIPLGYAKGASNAKSVLPTYSERPLMWSFAGSLDRPGREQSLATLRAIQPYKECSKPSWGSPNRVEGPDYTNLLETTKFVPCFRGSLALESFRLYETLESGAIPIYVPSESSTNGDEYRELFGQHPLLGFPSWEKAVEVLPKLASQTELMEKHRRSIQDWWLTKKETVRAKLANMFH